MWKVIAYREDKTKIEALFDNQEWAERFYDLVAELGNEFVSYRMESPLMETMYE